LKILETLRDNTQKLESQIVVLMQQNEGLLAENRELSQVSIQAEEILRERAITDDQKEIQLQQCHSELETLQNKYDALSRHQYETEESLQQRITSHVTADEELKSITAVNEQLSEENFVMLMRSTYCLYTCTSSHCDVLYRF
jgi:hypothetical protein